MRVSASPIYYGWFVLAAAALSEMLAQGATSYAAGLFVLPLQGEFHLSRADASSSILILFVGSALVSPFIGRILDRHSVRIVVALGALLFALSLAGIAASTSIWLMTAILLLPAAAGFMAIGPLTTAMLASRWFWRHRGLALGIAAVATSGGGLVAPLLSMAIQRYGWRPALLCEAVAIGVVIVVLALLVLRDDPLRMGLGDDPENQGRQEIATPGSLIPAHFGWKDILIRRGFWIPSLSLAIVSATSQAAVSLLVPYGVGLGFTPAEAAFLISGFAVAAATMKILAGLLADRLNPRFLQVTAALFMMLAWLTFSAFAGYWFLFVGSCLAGLALGCALPSVGSLMAAEFGSARFGAAMGWTYVLIASFAVGAVRFTGYIYDSTGSYRAAFETFAGILACLLVAALAFAAGKRAA